MSSGGYESILIYQYSKSSKHDWVTAFKEFMRDVADRCRIGDEDESLLNTLCCALLECLVDSGTWDEHFSLWVDIIIASVVSLKWKL